jgi:3-hydroxybutyrate dehydrogenase
MRRLLQIDEVAGYALYLVSDGAAGITGSVAVMDGGYTAQ